MTDGSCWPGLQTKEEKMISIKTAFGCAASGNSGISTFWLLVWAIAIDDDRQRRDKRRKKRDATPPHRPKPPAGPCP
jgi:hypothetical protein